MVRYVFLVVLLSSHVLRASDMYIHVFVHGTTVPGFLLLNQAEQKPIKYEDRYVSFIEKSRDDERFYDDSIMLECGLVSVGKPLIDQCKSGRIDSWLSRRAAVQAVTAYDDLVDRAHIHSYFLYGWAGLLSDDYRKKESEKLYHELIALKKKVNTQLKKDPLFILHGHSHGGNIVLYLALQEELNKSGLYIEHVMLYEMPVQIETAKYCLSPLFKNVSLLYSEGDTIQTADCFSTSGGKSYRTFSELVALDGAQNRVQEVLVSMNGNAKFLPHRAYFFFDAYYSLSTMHRNLFTKNMAVEFINPLPLVIFAPVFMQLLRSALPKARVSRCELNIAVDGDQCLFQINADHRYQRSSTNMCQPIRKIKERVSRTWRPYAKTSDLKKLFWVGQHIVLR